MTPPPTEVREVALHGGFRTIRMEIPREPAGPKPAIISPLADQAALLAAGAIVVTYQIHWEMLKPLVPPAPPPEPGAKTYGVWLLASPTPKTIGKGYFALIDADAHDTVPAVVDFLVGVPEVDPTRIGIAGASTNGFKVLQAVAYEPRLAVAVVQVACGDYHRFLHLSELAMKGEALDLDEGYGAWLREREPIGQAQRLVHAALLMVNGSDDRAIPLPCVEETHRVFRAAYLRAGVPERFRSVVLAGGTHTLGDGANAEAMAWWHRWLLRPGAPLPKG